MLLVARIDGLGNLCEELKVSLARVRESRTDNGGRMGTVSVDITY